MLDDWPRVPLPRSPRRLAYSVALGRRVARLLDPSVAVPGVTTGTIQPELREIAALARQQGGQVTPADFQILAQWGRRDARGAVMPGNGMAIERDHSPDEPRSAAAGALGHRTFDVHLNASTFWKNVPEEVWEFKVGGFQVLKKWLSYREVAILDRSLTLAEVNYFRDAARRIAAIKLIGAKLDRNYTACGNASWPWRVTEND